MAEDAPIVAVPAGAEEWTLCRGIALESPLAAARLSLCNTAGGNSLSRKQFDDDGHWCLLFVVAVVVAVVVAAVAVVVVVL